MNRGKRIEAAQETIQILDNKYYKVQDKVIDLSQGMDKSLKDTQFYTSEVLDQLIDGEVSTQSQDTSIMVENCTSMEARAFFEDDAKVGCLNFASAKNPGGGFTSGAQAQEESLSRASTLYTSLNKYFDEMYEYNRSQHTCLYSDRMIYSPEVVFFKDDDNKLLENPYCMDIVTSPAVNIGAMTNNNRIDELAKAKEVMLKRLDKILHLFYTHGVKNLILGAWGCGVFRNEPTDIAEYFAHYLLEGGKYEKAFNKIIFAVYDTGKHQQNYLAFKNRFAKDK